MKSLVKALPVILAALVLAGCGSPAVKKSAQGPVVENQGTAKPSAEATPAQTEKDLVMKALNDPTSLLSKRSVYFDFDSSRLSDQAREIVTAHAKFLVAHPDLHVTLEGNTDERGTREYNIGLGERRDQSVLQIMEFLGVKPDQISTISYGEEKPVAFGHDEASWRLNRRVDIVYKGF